MTRSIYYILFVTYAIFQSGPVGTAQETGRLLLISDDSLYIMARNMAGEGQIRKARGTAMLLLGRDPDNYDASVLIARLYAWEDNFDSARIYLNSVLNASPGYYDAMSALIDVEIWDGDYGKAAETASDALSYHPDDTGFLFQKARAYLFLNMKQESGEILARIMEIDPGNEDAAGLIESLEVPGFYYYRENSYLLAGYYTEFFREPYSRTFHMGTAGYSHYFRTGPVIARLNFASTRIDGTGVMPTPSLQYEIEFYPVLSPGSYLLLNYAYSMHIAFPDHRGAFEYFAKLPFGFEASAGLRFIYREEPYFFYTGSLGKYSGDMWFSVRPFIFSGENGLHGSWYVSARKYFNSADDFAGIVLGFGFSPDETLTDINERIYLNTAGAGIELSKSIGPGYLARVSLRYDCEEYITGIFRNRWTFNLGLRYYLVR